MKVALVGTRNLIFGNFGDYLPPETTEIILGGAMALDARAKEYAAENNIKCTDIFPDPERKKKVKLLKRNLEIIEHADFVVIFWDGESQKISTVIDICKQKNIEYKMFFDLNGLVRLAYYIVIKRDSDDLPISDTARSKLTPELEKRIDELIEREYMKLTRH